MTKLFSVSVVALSSILASQATLADRTVGYRYNDQGLLSEVDGPRTDLSDVSKYFYDGQGNLVRVENALGQITTLANYTGSGLPQRIVSANSVVTVLEYNAQKRLSASTLKSIQGDTTTTYTYTPGGLVSRITLPDATYLDYGYDEGQNLIRITNNAGDFIRFELDAMGNPVQTEIRDNAENLLKIQTRVFDEMGRLTQNIDADNHAIKYGYDTESNLTSVTDASLNVTARAFDPLNRLEKITNASLKDTRFTYDAQDNLTGVTDPRELTTTYQYNGFGEQIRQHSPDTGETLFSYDDAGNLIQKIDARNVVTQYQYDALNRLTHVLYPASPGENIQYFYDSTANGNKGVGRLTGITDQTGSTSYYYGDRGNLTGETRVIEGQNYTTGYAYDLSNKLTKITYPSGRIVNYLYNSSGQVDQVTTQENSTAATKVVVSSVNYLPFGPVNSLTYGNGITRALHYDQDYQLSGINSNVMQLNYGYDPVGNIDNIHNVLRPSESQSFGYDKLLRLTQADGVYGNIAYDYDDVGNRTGRQWVNGTSNLTETYDYASDSNRLNTVQSDLNGSVTSRQFGYSRAGNIITDQTDERSLGLTYNEQNRLESVTKDGPEIAVYLHNALGQRVIKVASDPVANQHFHFDPSGLLIAESQASGDVLRETIYLNGTPVAVIAQPSTPANTVTVQVTPTTAPSDSINFNDYSLVSYANSQYSGSQDANGVATVSTDGKQLTLQGNTWKSIAYTYTVTANTVMEFDFSSSQKGEIHAVGLDNDDQISSNRAFPLYGTQSWGKQNFKNYPGGGGVQTYQIPVGQFFTGSMTRLFFTMDHDVSAPTGESVFSNIRLYEANQ